MSVDSKVQTPLHYFHGVFGRPGIESDSSKLFNTDVECGLVIKEAPLSAHLNVRGDAGDAGFCKAVADVLGVALPTDPGLCNHNDSISIYWLGPSEWCVIALGGDAAELEAALRAKLSGHVSIVDISGGQTLINLRGHGVETVLKKSTVCDFEALPMAKPGQRGVTQSTFAKASAVISNRCDGSYDLIIRRSFADYIAQWLLDAGAEFGCRIER